MAHSAESTHWYTRAGEPAYTVIGANGNERATTLRDARKTGLVPSVTTILGVIDKPGLTRWKIDQALMAALTLPQRPDESLDVFKRRAAMDAQEQGKAAAERGTAIHAALQGYYEQEPISAEFFPFVESVRKVIEAEFGNRSWIAEKPFCSFKGYGGKVDLHVDDDCPVVLDFKTKDFGPGDQLKGYDEQAMQLDAYRHGLDLPNAEMVNVYVSRTYPEEVRVIRHKEGNYYERFCHLLEYWKLTKGYDPMA